jgi:NADPH:quinone reductase-like Zn-dependent oxidoreductase
MLAAVVTEWGAPPEYTEFPDPQPRDGAVVADVEASALTNLTISLPAGILRGNGIVMSGVGLGSVAPEVMGRVRAEALPRLFDMVASGELHLHALKRPLTEVRQAWQAAEPSGTRVVLTP